MTEGCRRSVGHHPDCVDGLRDVVISSNGVTDGEQRSARRRLSIAVSEPEKLQALDVG